MVKTEGHLSLIKSQCNMRKYRFSARHFVNTITEHQQPGD